MPRNTNKTRCSATTKSGRPCRAWSMHGSDLCSSHAKANAGAGAPHGNRNAQTHGFYSRTFTAQELADLAAYAGDTDLSDEIALSRVLLRRLFIQLDAIQSLDQADHDPDELNQLAKLVNATSRTVARLLRDQKSIGGSNSMADAIDAALDQIADELGADL